MLGRFRKQFHRPAAQIYFDGSSLGLCSQEAERTLLRALGEWKSKGSAGWQSMPANWRTLGENLAARVAALGGALPDEVLIANSRALNLHQLLATIYRRQFHRPRILLDDSCSPADRAIVGSHLELRGLDPEREISFLAPDESGWFDEGKFAAAMAQADLQMALVPVVLRSTGQLLDVARICRAARAYGVVIGLDLSLSFGVLPHALDEWDADFAFWDHGLFGNAGPGTAAGLYLNRRHFDALAGVRPGLDGGGDELAMKHEHASDTPSHQGATALQIGPPAILSLAPLDGALRALEEAGLGRVRAKSLDLTHFLRSAIEAEIPTFDFATPREAERRGGHLALVHVAAREICDALRRQGLSAGFRPPNLICLSPSPLFSSFVECWDAVQLLRRVVEQHAANELQRERELVS